MLRIFLSKPSVFLIKKLCFLVLGFALIAGLTSENKVHAVSYYGLSCTNLAYGTQITGTTQYIDAYIGLAMDFTTSASGAASNVNSTGEGGTYVGQDCL